MLTWLWRNISAERTVIPSGSEIDASFVQSLKARSPISRTVEGISMLVITQPPKAQLPIVVSPSGKDIEASLLQPAKALLPISVMPSGISILSIAVPSNAIRGMELREVESLTCDSDRHKRNTSSPIYVTELGISMLVSVEWTKAPCPIFFRVEGSVIETRAVSWKQCTPISSSPSGRCASCNELQHQNTSEVSSFMLLGMLIPLSPEAPNAR